MLPLESTPAVFNANDPTPQPKPGDLERLAAYVASSENENLRQFVDSLSESERSCVAAGDGFSGISSVLDLRRFLETGSPPHLEMRKVVRCLDDDSVSTLMIMGASGGLGPLSDATKTCMSAGLTGIDLRNVLTGVDEGELIAHGMASHVIVLSCLNDEEWQNARSLMTIDVVPEDQERLNCMVEHFGGPQELAMASRPTADGLTEAHFMAMVICGIPGMRAP